MGLRDELKRAFSPFAEEQQEEPFEFPQREQPIRPAVDSAQSGKVLNIHTTTKLQVVLVRPQDFADVQEIARHLINRCTVVLNLENTNKEAKSHIFDFLSGVVYAQDGKIKPIAKSTYLLTPFNVDILGSELMDELESSGAYFRE